MRGVLPAYLVSAEEKHGAAADHRSGAELYAALRGDLHAHSNWSDGGSPIEEMVLAAVELGQEWMALTDHSPRLTIANGLTRERLADQLKRVDAINASLGDAFTLLKGIEVDIHLDGTLDQDDDMLDQLDVVTASIHSKLRQPSPRLVLLAARCLHRRRHGTHHAAEGVPRDRRTPHRRGLGPDRSHLAHRRPWLERNGCVGAPVAGVQVRIDETTGELLVRGPW